MNVHDNRKERCVMARIMRDHKMYQKNFPVKRYQRWSKVREEAQKWVDEKKKTLPASRHGELNRMTRRNQSGVVGVSFSKRTVQKKNGKQYTYHSWLAKWPTCPAKGGIRWSINKDLSNDDAFVLAVITRRMLCSDRALVRKEFERIQGSKDYLEILQNRREYAPSQNVH